MSARHTSRKLLVTVSFASLLAACGASAVRGGSTVLTLAELRSRASAPGALDTARRDRTLAELVAPGGNWQQASGELDAMATARPGELRVRFARAQLELAHGDFAHALAHYVEVLDLARTSDDPMAPTLAEVAVGNMVALRRDTAGFEQAYVPAVDRVMREPGRLGAALVARLLETSVRWARERGLDDVRTRWTAAAGCPTEWTVAGPFGPGPMMRFEERLGPDAPGPLAASYELGAGRGSRAPYVVHSRGCAANLGAGRTDTGVFFAATDFTLEREGDVHLWVESPNVFAAVIDGVVVARHDTRREPQGTGIDASLHLTAGPHTLRIKLASRFSSPLLVASLLGPGGAPVAQFQHASRGASATAPQVLALPAEPAPRDPFEQYVRAVWRFSRHDSVGAREMLGPWLTQVPTLPPLTAITVGVVSRNDPFAGPENARDRARRAFERARDADNHAWFPVLSLADLAAQDDRADDALRMVRAANSHFVDNAEVLAEFAQRLGERQWDGEARAVVERAAALLPDVCWPQELRLALMQRHGDGADERAQAEVVARCAGQSDARAIVAIRQRRWDDATAEYERMLVQDPDGRGLRLALADILRRRGQWAENVTRVQGLLADNPEDTTVRADLADTLMALEHPEQARALVDAELNRSPSHMAELFRLQSVLHGRELLQPWRLDGREVLRGFNASGRTYQSGALLVLDYTVRRVFADGSALELTHNLVRVQSAEAIDEHATFSPPEGAVLLTLRNHKADGRVLEPEGIARLDAVAFPDVRPGDTVEFEYLRAISAEEMLSGGFLADRFYFRGFDEPYDRSEYTVVVPDAMAPRLLIDRRGPLPEAQRRQVEGGLTELKWTVRESNRMVPEPRSVASREFIPSVVVALQAEWPRYVEALRDRLSDLDPRDPAAERLAREVVGRASRPSEKLARLHRWVMENIAQEGAGTAFASAPVMVSARGGHRARVLRYLLGLVGVSSELALARPATADATPSELADPTTFSYLLLQVATEAGPRWVSTELRSAPATYIPPLVAGQPVLLLTPGTPRSTLPAFDLAHNGRDVQLRLVLARDGAGAFEATERMRGAWGVSWRENLRQIEPSNLRREFESYVGNQVTAALLGTLDIEHRAELDQDLVLRYRFTAPRVAVPTQGGLLWEGVWAAELGSSYAPVPERTTTQVNGEPLVASLDLTVVLPAGARVESLPEPHQSRTPGLEWSARYERTGDGFRYVRAITVPAARISPEQYAEFARQIHAVDTADAQRVRIVLP